MCHPQKGHLSSEIQEGQWTEPVSEQPGESQREGLSHADTESPEVRTHEEAEVQGGNLTAREETSAQAGPGQAEHGVPTWLRPMSSPSVESESGQCCPVWLSCPF